MNIPVFYLDAFTNQKFRGNPIAICPLEKPISNELMQNIAFEINFSETAFVWNENSDFSQSNTFNLKWFTPTNEVSLCGHGTLGTSALLFNYFNNQNTEIFFETLSGKLSAKKEDNLIWLNFPKRNYENFIPSEEVLSALGINNYLSCVLSKNSQTLLIELDDISTINPDFVKLKNIEQDFIEAVIVTKKNNDKYDFSSRYFTPWHGINEDPVTGSAHCLLSTYWSNKLQKNEMLAYQASLRGGEVNIKTFDNSDRVFLGGETVMVLKGELLL